MNLPVSPQASPWSPLNVGRRIGNDPVSPLGSGRIGNDPVSPLGSEASGSTLLLCNSDDNISISSASDQGKFVIPDSWPPAIMQCIKLPSDEDRKLALVPSVRNEIVRVLANNMFCHDPNPNKEFCTRVAKLLVKKFKFMKDVGEHVSGYVSFVVFILT